jgi:serine protease
MRPLRLLLTFLLMSAFLLNAAAPALAAPGDPVRVWVNYGPGRGPEVRRALANSNAAFHYDFPDLGAYVVTLPAAALNGIKNNPHVLYVEEDALRYPIADIPSTAAETIAAADAIDVNGQTVPYGVDMVQARDVWDVNRDGAVDAGAPTGANRTVCIIDTGYQQSHEDLPDAVGGYAQVDAPYTTDGYGHGSHVGGTIAAENNGLGVVGVTPGTAKLYIVKIFNDRGKWTLSSNLVAALNSCVAAGANVVSMSLGGSTYVANENTAFANAYNTRNVLSVAAAGNAGTTAVSYPAGYSTVISVAAIDSSRIVASFSQHNSDVELAAPGVAVLSTVPPNGYESWSGTSMATPHVSAVAALVWSGASSATNVQIRAALQATAQDLGAAGRDNYYGYGLVQAKAALDYLGGGGTTPTPTPVPTNTPTPVQTSTPTAVPTAEPTNTPIPGQLKVIVTTDKTTAYTNGQTVSITTAVTANDAPVATAAVTVTIRTSSGTLLTTLTGTTGVDGKVTLKYKINTRKTGAGTMTVTSNASRAGYTLGSGTARFTVL